MQCLRSDHTLHDWVSVAASSQHLELSLQLLCSQAHDSAGPQLFYRRTPTLAQQKLHDLGNMVFKNLYIYIFIWCSKCPGRPKLMSETRCEGSSVINKSTLKCNILLDTSRMLDISIQLTACLSKNEKSPQIPQTAPAASRFQSALSSCGLGQTVWCCFMQPFRDHARTI